MVYYCSTIKYYIVTCSEFRVKALSVLQTVLISLCFLLITVCYELYSINFVSVFLQPWTWSLVFKTNLLPHFTFFHPITSEGIIAHMKEMKNTIKFLASLFSLFQWHWWTMILGILALLIVWKGTGSSYSYF